MKAVDISREMLSAPVYPGDPSPSLEASAAWSSATCAIPPHCMPACITAPIWTLPGTLFPTGRTPPMCRWTPASGNAAWLISTAFFWGPRRRRSCLACAPGCCSRERWSSVPARLLCWRTAACGCWGWRASRWPRAECTVAVHRQLLSSGMVLLEGLDLSGVEEGIYFLMAAPLKIDGADGSPVRAILLERQT